MKTIQITLFSLFLFCSSSIQAQQTSLNTLYNQNNYLINPANVGLENCYSAYFNHRNQWTGINNSPTRNVLTIDGQLFEKHGLGLNLGMYEAGLLRDLNLKISYAYHVKLSKIAKLSFGVSAGLIQQSFQFEDAVVTDYSDKTIAGGNFSDAGFTSNAGVLFSTDRLKLGISLPQFISAGLSIENDLHKENYRLLLHSTLHGAYDIIHTEKWTMTPSLLYRNAAFNGNQVDIGLKGMWKSTLGFGAMYRSAYGLIGILELNLFDKLNLSYGYGFGNGNLTALSSGSHEIMLGLKFCKDPIPIIEDKTEEIVEIEEVEIVQEDIVEEVKEEVVEVIEKEVIEEEQELPVELPKPVETKTEITKVEEKVEEVEDEKIKEAPVPTPTIIEKEKTAQAIDLDSLNKAFKAVDRLLLYTFDSPEDIHSNNETKISKLVADILKEHPELKVRIEGHTCELGTSEFNKMIGQGRARNAEQLLIQNSVNSDRINVISEGENKPLYQNTSGQNRKKNRRAQFVFTR